jgi:hypothetical protein
MSSKNNLWTMISNTLKLYNALHNIGDNEIQWKKWVDFLKIRCHLKKKLNEIALNGIKIPVWIQIPLNLIPFKFRFRFNWIEEKKMQIDEENIENMLVTSIIYDYGVEKT